MLDQFQGLANAAMGMQQTVPVAGRIDTRTIEVAKSICGHKPDTPFDIGGGCCVPAWVMYVSEAGTLMKMADNLAKITQTSKR